MEWGENWDHTKPTPGQRALYNDILAAEMMNWQYKEWLLGRVKIGLYTRASDDMDLPDDLIRDLRAAGLRAIAHNVRNGKYGS